MQEKGARDDRTAQRLCRESLVAGGALAVALGPLQGL